MDFDFCSTQHRIRAYPIACIAACLLAGCQGDAEGPGVPPAVDGPRAEAEASLTGQDIAEIATAARAHEGPFGFATRDFVFVDTTRPTPAYRGCPALPARTLPTRVFYPALPPWLAASPPPADQVPVAPGGPFPIVAYAHGLTSRGGPSRFMAEHLASHGYIVAAPRFPLSNGDAPCGPTIADVAHQPGDLAFVMDQVAQLGGDDADLGAAVNPQKRGIMGFSAGGLTVLLAAYHPVLQIPGIQAAVAQAPVSCFLGSASYQPDYPVPTLILAGTADELVPVDSDPEVAFARAPAPVTLAELIGGTHSGFMNNELPFVNNTDTRECELLLSSGGTDPAGTAAFVADISAGVGPGAVDPSTCAPLCSQSFTQTMGATRQLRLARAATLAHFDAHLRGSITGAVYVNHGLDELPDVEVSTKP